MGFGVAEEAGWMLLFFMWGEGGRVRVWAVGRFWIDKSSAVNRISDIILIGRNDNEGLAMANAYALA